MKTEILYFKKVKVNSQTEMHEDNERQRPRGTYCKRPRKKENAKNYNFFK